MSLLEAELKTGRTHQIRVHLQHCGFPIAGDDKYGDAAWNKTFELRVQAHVFAREVVHLRSPRHRREYYRGSAATARVGCVLVRSQNELSPQRFPLIIFDWDGTLRFRRHQTRAATLG